MRRFLTTSKLIGETIACVLYFFYRKKPGHPLNSVRNKVIFLLATRRGKLHSYAFYMMQNKWANLFFNGRENTQTGDVYRTRWVCSHPWS